ncbi:hypothetical protein [Sphingopyxis fribergensis]
MFVAAQLVDIGFAALLVPEIEAMRIVPGITAMNPMDLYRMPYTHSLLGAVIWAMIFGALVWLGTRRKEAATGAALVVISHWFVDLLVHTPDLTLYGMPPKLGLGLWNHPLIAMPLEILLIGGAFLHYMRRTEAPGGNARLWILAGLLALAQAVDWFGPKSPLIRSPSPRRCSSRTRCSPGPRRGRAPTGGSRRPAASDLVRATQSRFRFLQLLPRAAPSMLHRTRREGLKGKFCSSDKDLHHEEIYSPCPRPARAGAVRCLCEGCADQPLRA